MNLQRVKKGSTVDVYVALDGYPSGSPTLALTLPDGTAFTATMSPIAAATNVASIADDRQTLTLSSSLTAEDVTRHNGAVAIKLDGQIIMGVADTVVGTALTLSAPLPSGGTPEAVAWLTHRAEIGPTYLLVDGPTAAAGRLDGSVTYTVTAPGDGQTRTVNRAFALDIEDRQFWTGLTVPVALDKLGALDQVTGGLTRLPRGPGLQGLIDTTFDEVRDHVQEAVEARGFEFDDVVGGGDFLEPHVLLLRAELASGPDPAAESDRLRSRAFAQIVRKARRLKLDTTENGKPDTDVNAGVRLPTTFATGLTTARTFTRGYIS